MARRRRILRPLDRCLPTAEPIDTKTFASRACGIPLSGVTWQHRDPVTYWVRRTYPKADPSDRSIWYLDPDMQIRAHRHLFAVAD